MNRYLGILVVALCLMQESWSVELLMFTETKLEGTNYLCESGEAGHCTFVGTVADKNIESAILTAGTCAVLSVNSPPKGDAYVLSIEQRAVLDFGDYNNKFRSFTQCQSTLRDLSCPPNTFVRKFHTFNKDYLSYFSANCFFPNSTADPQATLKSHPNTPNTPSSLTCDSGALRGLTFKSNFTNSPYLKPVGPVVNSLSGACEASGTEVCGAKQAICGFTVKTEEHSNALVELKPKCCDFGDPSALLRKQPRISPAGKVEETNEIRRRRKFHSRN